MVQCYVPDLSQLAGWPWTSSFTHLGPESLHLWKERWTWGSAGALQAQWPLSDIWSWSSTLSFKSHWAWSFQMLSNTPLYQSLTTPFPSCSPTSQASCSPRNPILPMVPRAQKWNPSSPSWLHLPLHQAEHRAGQYLISLQYYISSKFFNLFNKIKLKHIHPTNPLTMAPICVLSDGE